MSYINFSNLTKQFGEGEAKVMALRGIDLDIKKGEMVAIMGASGSGKSTMLNVIGTLDHQTEGEYLFDGKKMNTFKNSELAKIRNRHFGFVVQHFALINDYTVYENIEIPLEYAGIKRAERKERIKKVLEKLEISEKVNKRPTQLSGGQCQRVAIARALVSNPEVILADEPTGALDQKTGQQVIDIFKKLNEEGKTIIIVTHDSHIAEQCGRIIKIEDGVIV